MSKSIYLSPREINDYLLQIHGKVHRKEFIIYKSRFIAPISNKEISEELLNAEMYDMLQFVGLLDYAMDVRYEEMSDGRAGYIMNNNTSERAVHIRISSQYKSNPAALLAILAHEVCHKVLYVHGLYVLSENLNETFVEIATIYMGFGSLILNGYRSTSAGVTHVLGYLRFEVYKVAHQIMCVVFGRMKASEIKCEDTDIFAYDALAKWESEDNKTDLLNRILFDQEKTAAYTYRYIMLLENLLEHCKSELGEFYKQMDKDVFRSYDNKDLMLKNLTAFSVIYKSVVNEPVLEETPRQKAIDESLEKAVFELYTTGYNSVPLRTRNPVCPCCGEKLKNVSLDDQEVLVHCPVCKVHFRFNAQRWSPTKCQKDMARRKEERTRKYEDKIKCEVERRLEQERKIIKRTLLNEVPLWKRWLVKKYFES